MFMKIAKYTMKNQRAYNMFSMCRNNILSLNIMAPSSCCWQNHQKFFHSSRKHSNYYEALGIHPQSTQSDIKAAYYKLSKQFHPDRNQGSESAASKFREITQAYEVLGNHKSRRLYDKGIIVGGSADKVRYEVRRDEPPVEDDDQTKFYKSRFTRSEVKEMHGRSPIYDFDEWSRAHYGKVFKTRQAEKIRHERNVKKSKESVLQSETEYVIFFLGIFIVVICGVFGIESNLDTPKERAIRNVKKREKEAAIENTNSNED